MDVAHPFRLARRARRIEPERGLVGGNRKRRARLAGRKGAGEVLRAGRRLAADHEHLAQMRQRADERRDGRIELVRDEEGTRPAVGKDDAIDVGRQQRVERDGLNARLQRAPEANRKLDLVEQQQRDARLMLEAVAGEEVDHPVALSGQLRVGDRALEACGLDEDALFRKRP